MPTSFSVKSFDRSNRQELNLCDYQQSNSRTFFFREQFQGCVDTNVQITQRLATISTSCSRVAVACNLGRQCAVVAFHHLHHSRRTWPMHLQPDQWSWIYPTGTVSFPATSLRNSKRKRSDHEEAPSCYCLDVCTLLTCKALAER